MAVPFCCHKGKQILITNFPDEKAREKRTENQTLFDAFVEERTFLNWQSESDLSADIRQRRFVTKTFAKEILVFIENVFELFSL